MNLRALLRLGAVSRASKFAPSVAPLPVQQLHQRGVVADVVVVRRELQRAGDIGERLVEPSEPVEQIAAAGEGEREVRVERDRRVRSAKASASRSASSSAVAARIARGDLRRVERDRAVEALDRVIAAPQRRQDMRAVDPGFREMPGWRRSHDRTG